MAKLPKWRKEFNQRMAAQLRLFAKAKEPPQKLTKFAYLNGEVRYEPVKYYRSAWGNRVRNWRKERASPKLEPKWYPSNTNQPSS